MFTIILHNGTTFEILKEQMEQVANAIKRGDKHIVLPDGVISTSSISTILKTKKYNKDRQNSLAIRNKFECSYGRIHDNETGCDCKPLAAEQPIDTSRLLTEGKQQGVKPETLKKAQELLKKLNEQTTVEKSKETEWSHENFIRSHPHIHEMSEAIKNAYKITGL